MLKKIVLWMAVILLSCQIYIFSSATATESEGTSGGFVEIVMQVVKKAIPASAQSLSWQEMYEFCHMLVRKAAHFSIYAVLAVLTLFLARSYELRMKISAAISASYCLLYAISDEIHQLFVEGRSGHVFDVCIDFAGALFGIGIVVLLCKMIQKIKQRKSA